MRPTLAVTLLLAAVAPLSAADPGKDFFFKKGDRVVFLGDSITEQYKYSTDIELYLTTRFPNWNMEFINAGISGDRAVGGAMRFAKHVLSEKPTAVTIDFGMNDGGYSKFRDDLEEQYVRNTERMVDMAKKAGVRVALISPNAVEVRNKPSLKVYLETQQQFYAPLKEIAAKNGLAFVDQYAVTRKILEKMAADNAAVKPFNDGVHTSDAGGLLMAHTILVGLNAPGLVSDFTYDVPTKTVKAARCSVAKVTGGADGIAFERTDEALPLPVLEGWRDLLPYLDDLKDFNWYGLKVTGLTEGKYELLIDGTAVGAFTGQELAAGVNVGNLGRGPIFDQGMAVLNAINAKNSDVHDRFRGIMMYKPPTWLADTGTDHALAEVLESRRDKELARLKKLIDARQAKVYEQAQPTPHKFELKVAK